MLCCTECTRRSCSRRLSVRCLSLAGEFDLAQVCQVDDIELDSYGMGSVPGFSGEQSPFGHFVTRRPATRSGILRDAQILFGEARRQVGVTVFTL